MSRSTSTFSEDEDDEISVIPTPQKLKPKHKSQGPPAIMQPSQQLQGQIRKTIGASPRLNKVADEDSLPNSAHSSARSSPQFGPAGSRGSPNFGPIPTKSPVVPGQMGRHAGAHSIGTEEELNSSRKHKGDKDGSKHSRAASGGDVKGHKTLAPSSAQKKRGSVLEVGGPKKGSAKDYVASRVWKNESTMTFGMRVKLAEQPEMWADASFAATNIVDVWEHYDADKDDRLGRHEVQQLASDLVDRYLALYKAQLLIDQPALVEAELQKLIKKDVFPHMLAGENIVESKRIMTDRLFHELDLDHDGHVTKTEFFFAWKNTSKHYLTLKAPKGGLACVIL